jgi:hypothetical protein
MARARAVGVPTPEVLGVEHVEHDGELPAAYLEGLVMDGGELLARVHRESSRSSPFSRLLA